MPATKVYFSLSEITDPAKHRAHNEWHQLDHRPENLLLPGIAWGDRWVRAPDCAASSSAIAQGYENVHYAIMYWFREPLADSLQEFFMLSERSFQWGRSPQIGFTRRPMRGLFIPIKGYVAPRISVSAEALPRRPVKGVYVTLSRPRRRNDASELFRWHDEVRIPDLLQCHGAAGAWTFAAEELFFPDGQTEPGAWPFADRGARRQDPAPPQRLQILYLDEDPIEFISDVAARTPAWRAAGRLRDTSEIEEILFASPLRRIVPWEWSWFEPGAAAVPER